jgi:UDP-N-acetylmuramoyl-tripeptide--D-alanyl-D-alanine ligase
LAEGAAVRGIEPHPLIRRDEKRALFVDGMAFKIEFDGNVIPVQIPGALGLPPVFAALAACAVSAALALNPMVAIEGLRDFKASKGRLRVLDGIKFSSLIDDSYNASTGSMIEALRALRSVPLDEGESRIAVLGEMREMGAASEAEHRRVGASVVEFEVDRLVTVGEMARDILRGALEAGFPKERGVHFAAALEAGRFVQGILERGDTVLIKGSRGAHLERITRELMAEPLRAEELLEFGEPTT